MEKKIKILTVLLFILIIQLLLTNTLFYLSFLSKNEYILLNYPFVIVLFYLVIKIVFMIKKFHNDILKTIFHEIKTPISSILGLTSNSENKLINKINIESLYLLSLVNNHLEHFLNCKEIKFEHVNVYEVIEIVEGLVKPLVDSKSIDFIVINNLTINNIFTNKIKLIQILLNLISNSVKFSSVNKKIKLYLSNTITNIEISIVDEGSGMSNSFIKSLYKRSKKNKLTTLKEDTDYQSNNNGSGIGLGVVIKLVELLNGKIEIFSKINFGTRVKITLVNTQEITRLDIKEVLVVEDNQTMLEMTKDMLNNISVNYKIASKGNDALKLFKRSETLKYSLILLDLNIPNMSGEVLSKRIRKLKREDSNIPIVATTASSISLDEKKYKYFNDVLVKPYTLDDLKSVIIRNTR